jgi:TolA-binding protein
VWGSLLDKKNATISRRLVNQVIRLGISWFGASLANRFQDFYLARLGPTLASLTETEGSATRPRQFTVRERPDLLWYYKARNYHLYGRVRLARKAYVEIVRNYPQSEMAPRARLFWGILETELGAPHRGRQLLTEFVANRPSSGWKPVAHYYLGRAAEVLGDRAEAIKNYGLADPLYTDAPERIAMLMKGR